MSKIAIASVVLALGIFQAACSKSSSLSGTAGTDTVKKLGSSDARTNSEALSGSKDITTQTVSKQNLFRGVDGFLVKDSERLRATINECLDANLLTVQREMKAGAANATTGRKVILSQSFVDGGPDIIEQLADDLYNPLKVGRSETSAGVLSLSYLGALATVADVVAWNCDFADPNARCNCSTEESAKKILQRCIPSYTDVQLVDIGKKFAESCGAGKSMEDKRKALASFISSSTFAEAR
jgi:hypothetical protein